jgi:hypothetical protein
LCSSLEKGKAGWWKRNKIQLLPWREETERGRKEGNHLVFLFRKGESWVVEKEQDSASPLERGDKEGSKSICI